MLIFLGFCFFLRLRRGMRASLLSIGTAILVVSLLPVPHTSSEYIQFSCGNADAAVIWDQDRVLVLDTGEEDGTLSGYLRFYRLTPDAVYMNVAGVTDRDAAQKLRGTKLYIDRAHAVALDADSNFITDLYGLRGVADDGRDLGKLTDVMQPGGNDVYVFNGPLGEVLVPALKSVVAKVDL